MGFLAKWIRTWKLNMRFASKRKEFELSLHKPQKTPIEVEALIDSGRLKTLYLPVRSQADFLLIGQEDFPFWSQLLYLSKSHLLLMGLVAIEYCESITEEFHEELRDKEQNVLDKVILEHLHNLFWGEAKHGLSKDTSLVLTSWIELLIYKLEHSVQISKSLEKYLSALINLMQGTLAMPRIDVFEHIDLVVNSMAEIFVLHVCKEESGLQTRAKALFLKEWWYCCYNLFKGGFIPDQPTWGLVGQY